LLVGQIPSSIGQSTTLQSIDLTSNQLTGTIPDFASQSKIMQLWLANNKFTGHIPVTTGKLSALQLLDLSANHLTATIPTDIVNCQKIIHFDVGENSLTGNIGQASIRFLPLLKVSTPRVIYSRAQFQSLLVLSPSLHSLI
jgi:Leucine-rich repeat (LRR) protein